MKMKSSVFLTLLVLSLATWGEDFIGQCLPKVLLPQVEEVQFYKIQWWAASENQVKKANCSKKVNYETKDLNKYLDSKFPPNKGGITQEVAGIQFKNEHPELIKYFKAILYNAESVHSKYFNKDINLLKKLSVPDGCEQVRCALEHLYGQHGIYRVPRMLYGLDKFQVNTSHMPYNLSSTWKTSELDELLSTMENLPDHFFPLREGQMKTMYHFSRDKKYAINHSATIANAVMTYFGGYDQMSEYKKRYVVTHEIGHNVSTKLGDLDESKEWLQLSGWTSFKEKWKPSNKKNFVSDYAKTNPAEDFAETFTAYRFNPDLLKLAAPDKYDFMKKYVYQGVEYLDNKQCRSTSPIVAKVISGLTLPDQYTSDDLSGCAEQYADLFIEKSFSDKSYEDENLFSCLEKSMTRNAVEQKVSTLSKDEIYRKAVMNSIKESDKLHLSDAQKRQMKSKLRSEYIKNTVSALKNAIEDKEYFFKGDKSVSKICDSEGYSYLKFEFLKETVKDSLFPYRQKDHLNRLTTEICHKVLRKKIFSYEVSEADIKRELEKIVPR